MKRDRKVDQWLAFTFGGIAFGLAVIAVVDCGGAVESDSHCWPPADLPASSCRTDVVNDGIGPDAERHICEHDGQTWVVYPSTERWHWDTAGVICHVSPDGTSYP